MNIYIDTNIFLTFYHLTNDDLDELKKLALLIEDGQLKLYLPEQTRNEFVRNRDKTIANAISSLKEQKISSRYPQISKGYEEYALLKDAYQNFEKHKHKIISKIQSDAKEFKLNADILTQRIFKSAEKIEISENLINKAKTRYDLGNPPGKGKSYGDAMNWESLLESIEESENLHLISDDGDFTSLLDKKDLNLYLKDEWDRKKNSEILFYKTLSEFFKSNFPNIELSDQLEKEVEIRSLANASSFASAKTRLAKLSKYQEFTNKQLNDIVEIAVNNNQLYWINTDIGVGDKLLSIVEGNENKIEPELLKEFDRIYRPEPIEIEDDDLPFF